MNKIEHYGKMYSLLETAQVAVRELLIALDQLDDNSDYKTREGIGAFLSALNKDVDRVGSIEV